MVAPVATAAARVAVQRAIRAGMHDVQLRQKITGEKPSFVLYMVLGMFAFLKDLFDVLFIFLGPIGPALGFIFGACFSFLIFMLMFLFDRSTGSGAMAATKVIVRRAVVLLAATAIGSTPIFQAIPETTVAVGVLYLLARHFWKKRMREAEQQERRTSKGANQARGIARQQALAEEAAKTEAGNEAESMNQSYRERAREKVQGMERYAATKSFESQAALMSPDALSQPDEVASHPAAMRSAVGERVASHSETKRSALGESGGGAANDATFNQASQVAASAAMARIQAAGSQLAQMKAHRTVNRGTRQEQHPRGVAANDDHERLAA